MAGGGGLAKRRTTAGTEPDLSDALKAAIHEALRWAWVEVRRRWPKVVANGEEEAITAKMQSVLNEQDPETHRRRAPGMSVFETVGRGDKVTGSKGQLNKAPDLVFRPHDAPGVIDRGAWGLFAECKIIGKPSHHSPKYYGSNGVGRFVRGEYAPRVPSGMMVAYVRDGRAPFETLEPVLADASYRTLSHQAHATRDDATRSEHLRSAPCPRITLVHLWLGC